MPNASTLDAALAYSGAGLSVIPVRADGSKAAAVPWKPFQERIASQDELRSMFRNGCGIAVIAGKISGWLEILDFESGSPFDEWLSLIESHAPALASSLVVIGTPSGGHHVFYRCPEGIEGNQKLAMSVCGKAVKVAIETRGEGGYVLTVGSPLACHLAGKPYTLLQGDLVPGSGERSIPTITADERSLLLDAARCFNQAGRNPAPNHTALPINGTTGERPGDLFNQRETWQDVIGSHGWKFAGTRGDETFWRRPGKDFGFSATTNFHGSDLLYVFSTNAEPFKAETGHTKFMAYALLNHNGDFKSAARDIARRYGLEAKRQDLTPIESNARKDISVSPTVDSGNTLVPAEPFVDFAPAFLAVEDPPVRYLIDELLPAEIIALTHGEPRTRKSWALLEIAIALTTGKPAFGLPRFAVSETVPVLYSSQEDSERPVRDRMKRLLRGYGLDIPEKLAFAVHKGINLDDPEWQQRMLRDISTHQFKAVILDPVRRFSENVDKGPAEVRKLTAFLRQICIQTGAVVIANHHDVKPSSEKADTRRRSHKASGGDWFAASECPIAFEPAGENCSLVIPEDYKFSVDPKPFTFRIEEDPERTWARLVGEDSTAEKAIDLAAQEKVIGYLSEHSGASGSAIAKALKIRKDDVLNTLSGLESAGKIDSVKADKVGKATRWFVRKETGE